MYKHLCLPWKGVYQSSSIRGWHLFGRSESNICLMYVGTSLVYTLYKSSNKLVHLHPIITNITDFKGIIKVNMSCKKDFKTHIKRKYLVGMHLEHVLNRRKKPYITFNKVIADKYFNK